MTLKQDDLTISHGTSTYYQHPLNCFVYTDGVNHVIQKGDCYWLVDAIASYQFYEEIQNLGFQVWRLNVNQETHSAVLECLDENERAKVSQLIHYTDFPLRTITLYVEDGVLYMPSER